MKNKLIATLLTLSLAGTFLIGCSSQTTAPTSEGSTIASSDSSEATENIPLNYSFLYDEATKNEVQGIMTNDGVPAEQVDQFMATVTQFTDTMGEMKGAHDGFTLTNAAEMFYDPDYIGETFSKELKFNDQNCRLTAYSLFNSFYEVSSNSTFEDEKDSLYGDMEILKDNPNLKFSDEDLRKYKPLFADVAVDKTTDVTQLATSIKDTWAERGITFADQSKVQLASIMMHDASNGTVFAGHAGVVFQTDNGYLLIEKLAQYTPFVAGQFDNLDDLRTYMLSEVAFLGSYENSAEPFIMLNDKIAE